MHNIETLLANNRAWAAAMIAADPAFFERMVELQTPEYLWIGCADSRVLTTHLVDLPPGKMFVHRNVANLVVPTDLNCLSVLQYAVEVLHVAHVIVCGHYGCGGIEAVFHQRQLGLIDNWLRQVQDVQHKHADHLARLGDDTQRIDRLAELNVIEQVINVSQTPIVQAAWQHDQPLAVHGWIYSLHDGLLRDLYISIRNHDELQDRYQQALHALG